ncbi:hypothetical protein RvY_15000 [Ramazzottius varieornatus]|uniref:Eukaryotic translation initiation factor 3 subunit G n=1 Tax=Ramazzottius varieornatus TaxID=947166 RepID=A0A1D1W0E6_RAMVA|nr:hypothetical protein RvY_15000 [Ramazzottius varieornatus]
MQNNDQDLVWADELEERLGEGAPSVRRVGNRKIVTEIVEDEEGKKTKVVTEYMTVTKRVSKAVAERKRNWKKFGDAANDPPGAQTRNTKIADEVAMQFLTGREDVMATEQSNTGGLKLSAQVSCRICGGDHWTTQCNFQNASQEEKDMLMRKFGGGAAAGPSVSDNAAMEPSDGGATGKYVAPSRRAGFQGTASAQQGDQLPSVRVSNLPTDVKEEDLRDLFEQFGKIKKVYLGKDKRTQEFKGFAFVTFFDQHSADKAIAAVNGHRYFHMILSVDWANPSKP